MRTQAYWTTLLANARAGLLAIRAARHHFHPALTAKLLGEAALAKRLLRRGYHA